MKHLLLILLFIPFITIGQDITYEDLMSVKDGRQFQRLLIERNYERYDYDDEENISYAYGLTIKDGENWMKKAGFLSLTNDTIFGFPTTFNIGLTFFEEEDYNRIYDVAKKELKFQDVFNGMAFYSNEDGTLVGFTKQGTTHMITLLRFKKEEE